MPDELFDEVLTFLAVVFGQDDIDAMPEHAWGIPQQLLTLMLGPKGGRRGEQTLRGMLEGKTAKRELDVERKMTRGAVM
jgi:hypothetical protein